MDKSRIDKYNGEVASWLSKQTILFQFFKSYQLVGFSRAGLGYFFGAIVKLGFLILVLGVIGGVYFSRQHNDRRFADKVEDKIMRSMMAEEVRMSKLKGGVFSEVEVSDLRIKGTDYSFFDHLNVFGIRMDLGNMVTKKGRYGTSTVTCSKIDTYVKVSASSGQEDMYKSIMLDRKSWFQFANLEARSFNCAWGYSKNSKGSIQGARMTMRRSEQGCEIKLEGGTLTYSWLKEVDIETMVMVITPQHFVIKEATFRKGDSAFTLQLGVEKFGENPFLRGRGQIVNCNAKELIRPEFLEYVEGHVDSEFTFSGSPNSPKGMDYVFTPLSSGADAPSVPSDRLDPYFKFLYELPIIRALGAVDRTVNYRGLTFNNNDWRVEIRNGDIYASDVFLENDEDKIKLEMQFALKQPTQEYIDDTMSRYPEHQYIRLIDRPWLKEAGLELLERKKSIGNRMIASQITYKEAVELLNQEKHFFGTCKVDLHADAFFGKEAIREKFTTNSVGRRTVEVPLEGHVTRITQELADEIYYLSHQVR